MLWPPALLSEWHFPPGRPDGLAPRMGQLNGSLCSVGNFLFNCQEPLLPAHPQLCSPVTSPRHVFVWKESKLNLLRKAAEASEDLAEAEQEPLISFAWWSQPQSWSTRQKEHHSLQPQPAEGPGELTGPVRNQERPTSEARPASPPHLGEEHFLCTLHEGQGGITSTLADN